MPSYRYLREIEPEQPEEIKEYTKKEKMKNWWHYSWKWVAIGLVVLGFVIYAIVDLNRRENPDMTMGILTDYTVPDEVVTLMKEGLAPHLDDLNEDGEVLIQIEQYTIQVFDEEEDVAENPYSQMAGVTLLTSALANGDPIVFIAKADKVELYQDVYGLYGSSPQWVNWEDSQILSGLDLTYELYTGETVDGQEFMREYCIGIRSYEDTPYAKKENGEEVWEELNEFYQKLAG